MRSLIIPVLFTFLAVGCAADAPAESTAETAAPATYTVTEPTEHDAMCGCSIEDKPGCGNYIKVEGEFIVLDWHELGRMEYCKDKANGAKIKVAGAVKDEVFVATTYERVN